MANTCESVVRISGLKERLENFRSVHIINENGTDVIDASVGLSRYKADTGYEGSSCGLVLTDSDLHEYEDSSILPTLNLYIDSRWNEPHDWFRGIVSLYPELSFDINWGQAADLFAGTLVASNGEITELSVREDDQLTEEDLWLMGVGFCNVCDKPSVDYMNDLPCPHCLEEVSDEGR
jgi:hypothetical protein